jgi:cytoskeletal protein RodZ
MDRRAAFGEDLRKQRIEREVSLDEVARITKIRKVYLESIEEGRFEDLPHSEIFVLGFLRAYARHLGLDEQALITRYTEATGGPAPATAAPVYLAVPRERRWHLWPFLLGAILLTGGWSAFWLLQHRGPAGPTRPAAPVSSPVPPRNTPAGVAVPPPAPEAAQPTPADSDEPSIPQPEAPGPLQLPASTPPQPEQDPRDPKKSQASSGDLVIDTVEPCWMEIWQGSTRAVYRLVEAGERISLNGSTFTVTLGNRESATVRWKGAQLAPPPGEGMVVNRWKIPAPPGEEAKEP